MLASSRIGILESCPIRLVSHDHEVSPGQGSVATVRGMSRHDWNLDKAIANFQKHGVTFDEVSTVEDDPLHRTWPDRRHGWDDCRFVLVGRSREGRLLIVITSERGPKPRIITARRASKRERNAYETRN